LQPQRGEKMNREDKKIAFVASSGGHLEEISRLKGVEKSYDCFLVTEKSDFEIKDFCEKKYYVPMMNRRQLTFLPKFIWLFFRTLGILLKEKPDFIITTGALVAYPFCVVGKMLGIKVIYVESFARVTEPSLTGKLVYNLSDLFMVQWEDMLKEYPKSMLGGGIF
jgi:UDP-N-acetylglucosamine:LPS N-acetylglucosamine transferase